VFAVSYDATGGLLPDAVCPGWSLTDSASPEDPVITAGSLTLSTSADGENMSYVQTAPDIVVGDPLIVEARMRFISGASSAADSRAPAALVVTTAPEVGTGTVLYIAADEIFLLSGAATRGATAFVDTDDAFHTYRLEADGGDVRVFQDNVQVLDGATFNPVPNNGSVARVAWGDVTSLAHGVSEWQYVRHTAPSTAACSLTVGIVIKPGGDAAAPINPSSRGKIPVAILSTPTFDAPASIIAELLTFGRTGTESSFTRCDAKGDDVDGDGLTDLVCHFDARTAGFQSGDTEGFLQGTTWDGTPVEGSATIRTVGR
jgi:hypothetical protein